MKTHRQPTGMKSLLLADTIHEITSTLEVIKYHADKYRKYKNAPTIMVGEDITQKHKREMMEAHKIYTQRDKLRCRLLKIRSRC